MARAYTVTTSALALGVSAKWVDNTLSQHRVIGVSQQKQGVARRLSVGALVTLHLSLLLIRDLSIPLGKAIVLSESIVEGRGTAETEAGIVVQIDLEMVRSRLDEQLESAVESAPVPRRGRPPKSKTGRLE
jgi:hypothetical protein